MTKEIIVLVGPPGSLKTTHAKAVYSSYKRVSQDDAGKEGHWLLFQSFLKEGNDIIVDRMGFSKEQRERYLKPAREAGYKTKIVVLHENYDTCFDRCMKREGHPTIKTKEDTSRALNFFFSKYERVEDSEADVVERVWPTATENCIVCDIDNTLADTSHRAHHVENGAKNWKAFFNEMGEDKVNKWCDEILFSFERRHTPIVLSSGRPDDYRKITESWLLHHDVRYDNLFMRRRGDYRKDDIVKEIILEWEIKTRYNVLFALDDRKQVIDMLRRHNIVVLDCAGEKGNF